VDLLLLSEALNKTRLLIKCQNCGYEHAVTVDPKQVNDIYEKYRKSQCPECKSNQYTVVDEKDVIEDLGNMAEERGTKLELLSKETEEGTALFYTFGGVAALLRFQV
ncbi:MAG: peptide chain release factor aRF-1, partial [Promethearchaeota archaeon]